MRFKFLNQKTAKQTCVIVDILVPFSLYFSLKAQNLCLSVLLMVAVALARFLLVFAKK